MLTVVALRVTSIFVVEAAFDTLPFFALAALGSTALAGSSGTSIFLSLERDNDLLGRAVAPIFDQSSYFAIFNQFRSSSIK